MGSLPSRLPLSARKDNTCRRPPNRKGWPCNGSQPSQQSFVGVVEKERLKREREAGGMEGGRFESTECPITVPGIAVARDGFLTVATARKLKLKVLLP